MLIIPYSWLVVFVLNGPLRQYSSLYRDVGWLVGCFGLRQYFSLYRAVSRQRRERIDERKNVQKSPNPHVLQVQ